MKIIDAGLKFNNNYAVRSGSLDGYVLHHAAGNGSVQDVHAWHLHNGWAGIGYHFYVRKDGSVYRGRPENWVGAHTVGHNSTKLGICAEGNFENEKMSEAQKNAIIEVLEYLRGKYGDLPVYGHRDLDATGCPGRYYPFDEIVNGTKTPGDVNGSTESENTCARGCCCSKCPHFPKKADEYTLEQFVSDVQEATGATVDGDPGPETIGKTVTLSAHENSDHAAVKAVQKRLYALGYTEVGEADGIAGPMFTQAVERFQRDNGCEVDGEITAGHKTWRKLLGME